jgi:hypothetical protein
VKFPRAGLLKISKTAGRSVIVMGQRVAKKSGRWCRIEADVFVVGESGRP